MGNEATNSADFSVFRRRHLVSKYPRGWVERSTHLAAADIEVIKHEPWAAAVASMDYEVELNYRLTAHLESKETVLATLVSIQHGIYAATDRRILCLNNESIGYRLRVHPYDSLDLVDCLAENGAWFVQFKAGDTELTVRARSESEAKRFTQAISKVDVGKSQTVQRS